MKQYLESSECINWLLNDTNANWSRQGARALVAHLEEQEIETDNELEFCVYYCRKNYTEFSSAFAAAVFNGWEPESVDDNDDNSNDDYDDEDYVPSDQQIYDATLWLEDRTTVIFAEYDRVDRCGRHPAISCNAVVIENFA